MRFSSKHLSLAAVVAGTLLALGSAGCADITALPIEQNPFAAYGDSHGIVVGGTVTDTTRYTNFGRAKRFAPPTETRSANAPAN